MGKRRIPNETIGTSKVAGGVLEAQVVKVLQTLSPREEKILRRRLGLKTVHYTPKEVGRRFAVTSERIRQIEAKALRKLVHPSRRRS